MSSDDPSEESAPGAGGRKILLNRLAEGRCPCLTKGIGRALAEAASVCINHNGHQLTASLRVEGEKASTFELRRLPVNGQMSRAFADLVEATEQGAAAIGILLVEELTEFHAVHRAVKKTGIDYWLAHKEDEDLDFKARLEVSGTLSGGPQERKKRVRRKLQQTEQSAGTNIPAIVVVTEFGGLVAEMAVKP